MPGMMSTQRARKIVEALAEDHPHGYEYEPASKALALLDSHVMAAQEDGGNYCGETPLDLERALEELGSSQSIITYRRERNRLAGLS